MTDQLERLTQAARQLPPDERVELVESILATLAGSDPEIERAWAKEAQDRMAAVDSGEMALHDAKEVMAEARRRISK